MTFIFRITSRHAVTVGESMKGLTKRYPKLISWENIEEKTISYSSLFPRIPHEYWKIMQK